MNAAPRQTLSYLRGLLEAHGIHPKNKLGQNFLIDLNIVDLIVRTADLSREDCVLEVGTGTGSLTAQLADLAGAVLSIEIDPAFYDLAQGTVAGHDNVVSHTQLVREPEPGGPTGRDAARQPDEHRS